MTTLSRQPEAASKIAPLAPPIDPAEPKDRDPAAAERPAAPAEILPMLIENPAWPRIFPGL